MGGVGILNVDAHIRGENLGEKEEGETSCEL